MLLSRDYQGLKVILAGRGTLGKLALADPVIMRKNSVSGGTGGLPSSGVRGWPAQNLRLWDLVFILFLFRLILVEGRPDAAIEGCAGYACEPN